MQQRSAEFYREEGIPVSYAAGYDSSRPIDAIFINAPLPTETSHPLPTLGLGYLASDAERTGLNVAVVDGETDRLSAEQIAKIVNELGPRWVGLNPLAPTYRTAAKIASLLESNIKLMIGGHEAKARPFEIMQDPAFARAQALIIGEGEHRVTELLLRDIRYDENACPELPATVWRNSDNGELRFNTAAHGNKQKDWLAPNLGRLAFLNRNFLRSDLQLADGRIEANMVGARGCPYDCSFCGAAVSANPDITIRARTPRDILEEMDYLYLGHNVTAFRFVDDLFLGHRRFMQECMQAFASEDTGLMYKWDATGRINTLDRIDDKLLDDMVTNGCREIALGIESGSERVLHYIDKRINPDMIKRVVERVTKRGISVKGYFILGLPTETRAEMAETVKLAHELWELTDNLPGSFRVSAFEFRPYPGTPEWDRLMKTGRHEPEELLAYTAVDLSEIGHDLEATTGHRREFNFSVGIQFGEATVKEVRQALAHLTHEQYLRRQQISSAPSFPRADKAYEESERWRQLLDNKCAPLGIMDNGEREESQLNELRKMRLFSHQYHTGRDPAYKADANGPEWASNNLKYYKHDTPKL